MHRRNRSKTVIVDELILQRTPLEQKSSKKTSYEERLLTEEESWRKGQLPFSWSLQNHEKLWVWHLGLELVANPGRIVRVNGAHLKHYYTPPSSPTPNLSHKPQDQSPDQSRSLDISLYCSWRDVGGSLGAK